VSDFFQHLFDGFALGCIFALIALGFTVIYRSSQVINFAQGSLLLLGAYLVAWFHVVRNMPFGIAVLLAILSCALVGVVFQVGVLRRLTGQPVFTVVMITIGLNIVLTAYVPAAVAPQGLDTQDPWGLSALSLGAVTLSYVKIWGSVTCLAVLGGFFAFDRYSRYGLAMRATASDEEAALAAGVPTRRANAVAWALAGAVAAIGGLFLAGSPGRADPTVGLSALSAFPAIILGGLESPLGAVIGGITIGLVQVLTATYQPNHASWLGANFYIIAPYIVMILVLLVRPYGLLGQRPVERV
jgi:branched-chain amino acid transport system permease protein